MSISEPKKFLSVSCAARANARPPIPRPARTVADVEVEQAEHRRQPAGDHHDLEHQREHRVAHRREGRRPLLRHGGSGDELQDRVDQPVGGQRRREPEGRDEDGQERRPRPPSAGRGSSRPRRASRRRPASRPGGPMPTTSRSSAATPRRRIRARTRRVSGRTTSRYAGTTRRTSRTAPRS